MVRDVVQVDGSCMLLQELNAFYADLEELLEAPAALLQLKNAILLVWLVLLRHDDLLKSDWIRVV